MAVNDLILGSISDYVLEITMITYDGTKAVEKTYSAEKDGEDVMNALRVNLGCFGIMYSMKMQLIQQCNLCMLDQVIPVTELLNAEYMKKLHTSNDYVEIFLFPLSDEAWIKTWNYTNKYCRKMRLCTNWIGMRLTSQ